jgi:hypothetical protein
MKQSPNTPALDPNVLAALHLVGQNWRVVVARRQGSGLSLIDARAFAPDQSSRVRSWLHEKQVGRVYIVLPSASVICRTCPLPSAGGEQLLAALRLQAEAHLLGGIPQHRIALAVLPQASGETSRSGIILAWPEAAPAPAPPGVEDFSVTYVPEVASLAALLNSHRPTEALVWLNREDGSVALAITHTQGAVFRATREAAEDAAGWPLAVGRVLTETALSVGHTPEFVESIVAATAKRLATVDRASLLLPPSLIESLPSRLAGASNDAAWWSTYGVAAGALVAAAGDLAPLGDLRPAPPSEKPTFLGGVTATLSRPRVAAVFAVAAIALLAFAPVAFAGLRYAVLKFKVGDRAAVRDANISEKKRVAMYQELRKQSWPMLKVFSDVCCALPEGIELDSISVVYGEPVVITGVARASGKLTGNDIVLEAEENLTETGMFAVTSKQLDPKDAKNSVKFRMNVNVVDPWRFVAYTDENDFAKKTMRERRWGPAPEHVTNGGSPPGGALASGPSTTPDPATSVPSSDDEPASAPSGASSANPTGKRRTPQAPDENAGSDASQPDTAVAGTQPTDDPEGSSPVDDGSGYGRAVTGPAGGRKHTPPSRNTVPEKKIPDAVTQQQVDAMTKSEAKEALAAVAEARQSSGLDDETKARLKNEFDMLMKRVRQP